MAWALVFPTNIFSRGIWHVVKLFLDPAVREKTVLLGGGRQPPGLLALHCFREQRAVYVEKNTIKCLKEVGVLPLLLRFFNIYIF